MDTNRAIAIVSALVNGVNPLTGEVFPAESPYQASEVVRALFVAAEALKASEKAARRTDVPRNAGKPWTTDEDERLRVAFAKDSDIKTIAKTFGRTPAGIQARLERQGLIEARRPDDMPKH